MTGMTINACSHDWYEGFAENNLVTTEVAVKAWLNISPHDSITKGAEYDKRLQWLRGAIMMEEIKAKLNHAQYANGKYVTDDFAIFHPNYV